MIHNRKYLKETRKELRSNLTTAEATLWKSLQKSQLKGRKFRRQHSIENFIVDFYYPKERLIIELDGAQHYTSAGMEADQEHDQRLRELGFAILRFENIEVFKNLEGVLDQVSSRFDFPAPKEGYRVVNPKAHQVSCLDRSIPDHFW